jgi:hypothetical protein
MLELEKVLSLFDVYLTASQIDPEDENVAIFKVESDLGIEGLTISEVKRPDVPAPYETP